MQDEKPKKTRQFKNRHYRWNDGVIEKWANTFVQDIDDEGNKLFEKKGDDYIMKGSKKWIKMGEWTLEYFMDNIIFDGVTNKNKKAIYDTVVPKKVRDSLRGK